MHIELLVEDGSGARLLEIILPKIIDKRQKQPTWRIHSYKGIGRLPKGMQLKSDPKHRILLDRVPRIVAGYAKTPGINAVVIVLDSDKRDCTLFLSEIKTLTANYSSTKLKIIWRLAIEEIEAWYLGDRAALLKAYPQAKKKVLNGYEQDSVCNTWELLADAIYPGGMAVIRKAGWPLPGQIKHEWAEKIGPHLDVENNLSPSFGKLRDGLRSL